MKIFVSALCIAAGLNTASALYAASVSQPALSILGYGVAVSCGLAAICSAIMSNK